MKFVCQVLVVFILVFSFKIAYGVDTVLIFLSIGLLINYKSVQLKLDSETAFLLFIFCILIVYTGTVSILYVSGELIFFLKFLKTALLLFLLSLYFPIFSQKINYQLFQKLLVYAVFLHSIIIILNILSPEFRNIIYTMTGYSPRGPEWSRSPGVTISFNSTAILHLSALYIIIFRDIIQHKIMKILTSTMIFLSLIFLGRTMAFVGLSIIGLILFVKYTKVALIIFLLLISAIIYIESVKDEIFTPTGQHIVANYNHFILPILNLELDYVDTTLSKHIYFSDKMAVLLFGDSYAGHIGILGGKGETDSDIGLINSINANGMLITAFFYVLYFLILYFSRKKDWQLISYVIVLNIILTLKETGFFTSNVTTLIFLLYLYQRDNNKIRKVV